jgi:lyso-ornithine lipid O-acyltransferase
MRGFFRTIGFVLLLCVVVFDLLLRRPRSIAQRAAWMQKWSIRFLRYVGLKMDVPHPAPSSGAMVCNHLSYLDILVLGAQRPTLMVAKSEVRRWPLIGTITAGAGTIYVERERSGSAAIAAEQMAEAVRSGVFLLFFPEGTSGDGTEVLPFRSPLFQPLIEAKVPIWPAHLSYGLPASPGSDLIVQNKICYWGDMNIVSHLVGMLQLRNVSCTLRYNQQPVIAHDRKVAAHRCHELVEAMHRDAYRNTYKEKPSADRVHADGPAPAQRTSPANRFLVPSA